MKKILITVAILTLSLTAFGQYKYTQVNPFDSIETSVRGVNDNGAMVGDYATTDLQGMNSERGFLFSRGKFYKIEFAGAEDTDAQGISAKGVILGMYDYRNDLVNPDGDHGFLLDKWGYHPLPDPTDGDAFPDFNGINEWSDVVGVLSGVIGTTLNRGFLLPHGSSVYTVLDCGVNPITTNERQTEANGIDNHQNIVGECSDFDTTSTQLSEHGFYFDGTTYHVFDVPNAADTIAWGISDNGKWIVGQYTDAVGDHGFIVSTKSLLNDANPKFKTIDKPKATDTTAKAVNDDGQVVGVATRVGGRDVGFSAKK